MKEQNNIDEIFKEAFDQFEVDPGVDVWAKVQTGINTGAGASSAVGAAGTSSSSWVATAIVGLAISAAAVGGYYFFNQKGEAKVEAAIEANKTAMKESEPINKNSVEEAEANSLSNVENSPTNDQNVPTTQKPTSKQKARKKLTKDQSDPVRQLSNGSKGNSKIDKGEGEETVQSNLSASENLNESASNQGTESSDKNTSTSDKSDTPVQSTNQSTESSETEKSVNNKSSTILESAQLDGEEKMDVHIEFPTAFTPNQDGTNDKFIITKELSKGLSQVQEGKMLISNNTGKTVAVWKGVNGSWDGTLPDGSNAPKGNYLFQFVYSINGEAQTPIKGLIFLNR